jgi:glycosyltransferase involved in cell wall biosynthesis
MTTILQYLKFNFRQLLKYFGFELNKINSKNTFLANVYKSNFDKSVLISYLLDPFINNEDPIGHTNFKECITAGLIFNELGFNVDVVHLEDKTFNNFNQYDVIYGMGEPFENYFYQTGKKKGISIFYATGCNPNFSNNQSALRVYEFYKRTGVFAINSSRILLQTRKCSTIFSDGIITLGNDFVKKTYNDEINIDFCQNIDCFYLFDNQINLNNKSYSDSKLNFLWFGSLGKIHKGLDIVLEIFLKRDDITLHVACDLNGENEFWDYYLHKISERKNIILHGFIDVKTDNFTKILYKCGAIIFPSISEGGSPTVLTVCANAGLYPIISKNCGLDLDEYGSIISEITSSSFEKAINEFLKIEPEQLQKNSIHLMNHVREKYNYENYYYNLKNAIKKII